MPGRRPEETAAAFDRAAAEVSVPYALVGGIAVGAWGQPRATQDVDCLLDLSPSKDEALARALEAESLRVNARDFAAGREERSHITIFDDLGPFHVDCKLAMTPDEKQQVREAVVVPLSVGAVRVVRPEETIVYKVKFGTPRDLQDAASILAVQRGKLDKARITAFAIRAGVAKEVAAFLQRHER